MNNCFPKGKPPTTQQFFFHFLGENTFFSTYLLKDYQDQNVSGAFYEQELLKRKHPDIPPLIRYINELVWN